MAAVNMGTLAIFSDAFWWAPGLFGANGAFQQRLGVVEGVTERRLFRPSLRQLTCPTYMVSIRAKVPLPTSLVPKYGARGGIEG